METRMWIGCAALLAASLTACSPSDRPASTRGEATGRAGGGGGGGDGGGTAATPADAGAITDAGATCSGDIVADSSRCLQDDAFCEPLPDGRWCTGPSAPQCPAGSTPIAMDALCPPGQRCWQYSESLRCQAEQASTDATECEACQLETQLEMLTPLGAVACGEFAIPQSADTADAGQPASAATACVEAAMESGRPFTATGTLQGIDSQVRFAWVATADGALALLMYDSDVCGGSGCRRQGCGPRVARSTCRQPELSPDSAYGIECEDMTESQALCGPAMTMLA